uniref:Uncharacterized protein n=1 Tax=Steinernema glaseri TaxID=37863 RepID=A0A1I7ZH30_9BILA
MLRDRSGPRRSRASRAPSDLPGAYTSSPLCSFSRSDPSDLSSCLLAGNYGQWIDLRGPAATTRRTAS